MCGACYAERIQLFLTPQLAQVLQMYKGALATPQCTDILISKRSTLLTAVSGGGLSPQCCLQSHLRMQLSRRCRPFPPLTPVPHWPLHKPNLGSFLLLPPVTPDLPCAWGRGPGKGWVFLGQVPGRAFSAYSFPDSVRGVPFPSCDLPPLGRPDVWTLLVPWRLTMNVLDTEPLDVTWPSVWSLSRPSNRPGTVSQAT